MARKQPKQKSQPKQGDPIDIPVPKRKDFDSLLKRAIDPPAPPRKK